MINWLEERNLLRFGTFLLMRICCHATPNGVAWSSLTETAKLSGLDPEDYLRQVLERIADHPVKPVHQLPPWNLDDVRTRLDQRDAA